MHRLAIAAWTLLLVACTQTVADDAVRACEPLCQCADAPLPGVQRDCNTTCVMQFERTPLPESCTACIASHADRCTTLISDCSPFCAQVTPLAAYIDR
ncbi:MAG TPA: hypothetical protein VF469_37350 [Kofleriaceae bacterium]